MVSWALVARWAGRSLVECPDQLPRESQPCVAISLVLTLLPHPDPSAHLGSDTSRHLGCSAASPSLQALSSPVEAVHTHVTLGVCVTPLPL